jgi:CspA family cold shock protein
LRKSALLPNYLRVDPAWVRRHGRRLPAGARPCRLIQPKFDPPYELRRPFYQLEFLLMASGTVKWFNAQKGYGFIQPENGGPDVFVHISAVEQAGMDGLNEGQKLSYELEQGQRGRVSAVNLQAT